MDLKISAQEMAQYLEEISEARFVDQNGNGNVDLGEVTHTKDSLMNKKGDAYNEYQFNRLVDNFRGWQFFNRFQSFVDSHPQYAVLDRNKNELLDPGEVVFKDSEIPIEPAKQKRMTYRVALLYLNEEVASHYGVELKDARLIGQDLRFLKVNIVDKESGQFVREMIFDGFVSYEYLQEELEKFGFRPLSNLQEKEVDQVSRGEQTAEITFSKEALSRMANHGMIYRDGSIYYSSPKAGLFRGKESINYDETHFVNLVMSNKSVVVEADTQYSDAILLRFEDQGGEVVTQRYHLPCLERLPNKENPGGSEKKCLETLPK